MWRRNPTPGVTTDNTSGAEVLLLKNAGSVNKMDLTKDDREEEFGERRGTTTSIAESKNRCGGLTLDTLSSLSDHFLFLQVCAHAFVAP